MSGLIKGGSGAAALAARPVTTYQPVQREEADRLHRRIAVLEQEVRAREAEFAEASTKAEADAREAYQAGHAAGLAEAEQGAADRLALLGAAIADAHAELREHFVKAEQLALLVAEEALARMFAQTETMAPVVEQLIRRQVAGLETSTILTVSVSALDFDHAGAAQLPARLGMPGLEIRRVDDLSRGGCSIQLALGEIDAGLPQQWSALRAFLARLAEENGA